MKIGYNDKLVAGTVTSEYIPKGDFWNNSYDPAGDGFVVEQRESWRHYRAIQYQLERRMLPGGAVYLSPDPLPEPIKTVIKVFWRFGPFGRERSFGRREDIAKHFAMTLRTRGRRDVCIRRITSYQNIVEEIE